MKETATLSTSDRLRDLAKTGGLFAADRERILFAADAIEDRERLRAALLTLSRYEDGLRASNWPGLADVIHDALHPEKNGRGGDDG